MTLTLVADEFGLLHAAVPHPCLPSKTVQVMVLEAEDGWWTYVDGERIPGAFQSAQQAGRAALGAIDGLRGLAKEAAIGAQLKGAETKRPAATHTRATRAASRTRWSRAALAASFVLATSALTAVVVHATGMMNRDVDQTASLDEVTPAASVFASVTDTNHASIPAKPEGPLETWLEPNAATTDVQAKNRRLTRAAAATIDAASASGSDAHLQPAPGRTTRIAPLPARPARNRRNDVAQTQPADQARVDSAAMQAVPAPDFVADSRPVSQFVEPESTSEFTRFGDDDSTSGQALTPRRGAASLRTPNSEDRFLSRPDVQKTRRTRTSNRAAIKRRLRRAAARTRRVERRRTAAVRANRARRVQRLRARQSRRNVRAAIRRVKRARVRRAYKAAFGRN